MRPSAAPAPGPAPPPPEPVDDEPAEAPRQIETSFEAFYASEAAALHRAVAATLPDPSRAADAVDEAMARACASWDRVGRYDAPAGWVYRVAVNWATSRWRKLRREASLTDPGTRPDREPSRPDPDSPRDGARPRRWPARPAQVTPREASTVEPSESRRRFAMP